MTFVSADPRTLAAGQIGNQVSQQSFAFRRAQRVSALTPDFLRALEDGCWHRGRDLCRELQTDERTVRLLADHSQGRVISSGKGYRLLVYASNAEIDHAEARLLSQARKMTERATEIRRARNHSTGRDA